MQTSAQTPETPAIKAKARFSADHLRWVFAARAEIATVIGGSRA